MTQQKTLRVVALLRVLEHGALAVALWPLLGKIWKRGLFPALIKPILSWLIAGARRLPGGIGSAIEGELAKETQGIERQLLGDGDPLAIQALPDEGHSVEHLCKQIQSLRDSDKAAAGGPRKWAGIYHESESTLSKLQLSAIEAYHESNALYPGVFPSLRKMEAEVTAMAVNLLHGACGLLTSGGTESIFLAVLAHREKGYQCGVEEPEVVCCITAHPAVDKACHYLGLRLVKLDQDSKQQLCPSAVRKAITRNTVLVYASAPTFPHGVVDPIVELGALCSERGVGLHVDNCLGGIYLSSLQQLGYFTANFDFRVSGVTSMSIDIHKYGYASKGASVVAFAEPELRRATYLPVAGLEFYVTTTTQGSRGGAAIAAAWVTLQHFGRRGYEQEAEKLWSVHQRIGAAIKDIDGVQPLVCSDACVVPIAGVDLNIFAVAAHMEKRGWNLFTARDPNCLCLCYGAQHVDLADDFIADLRASVAHVRANPGEEIKGDAAVYGAASVIPDDVLMEVMRSYCDIRMTVKASVSQPPQA